MINRIKLDHILEYAKQQRHVGLHCKVPPEDMIEIVEMAMLQGKAETVSQPYTLSDGYALVPIEPTEEMLAAAKEWTGLTRTAEIVYSKMIAAAPQQEEKP